ncbi:MAG: hypothetical protein ACLFO3_06850, partial [Candidatus Acetothermia bacterium]
WIRIIPLQVGISFMLAFGLGLKTDGIWLGLFTTNILSGTMAFMWYRTGSWKRRVIKEPQPEAAISEEIKESIEAETPGGTPVD